MHRTRGEGPGGTGSAGRLPALAWNRAELQGRPTSARHERAEPALGNQRHLQNPKLARIGETGGRAAVRRPRDDPRHEGLPKIEASISARLDEEIRGLLRVPRRSATSLSRAGAAREARAGRDGRVHSEGVPQLRIPLQHPTRRHAAALYRAVSRAQQRAGALAYGGSTG